jgi:hypothetical protein
MSDAPTGMARSCDRSRPPPGADGPAARMGGDRWAKREVPGYPGPHTKRIGRRAIGAVVSVAAG